VRVLLDARTAAMIHGITGPLVFAFGSFIVMVCSRDRQTAAPALISRWLRHGSFGLLCLAIVQLILGAQLRHAQPDWKPALFTSLVHTHLLLATLITIAIVAMYVRVRLGIHRQIAALRWPTTWLVLVLFAQVCLGLATWVANYAMPWIEMTPWLARYTLQGKGFWESMIVTGHQATGSALIVLSLWLYCRLARRQRLEQNVAPNLTIDSIRDFASDASDTFSSSATSTISVANMTS
jgi:heme a synthase